MLDKILLASLLVISSFETAHASPTAAHPAPATRGSDMVVEKVEVSVSSTLSLKADFYVPKGEERAPAALLIHDAGSDRSTMKDLAERMWKEGYAVLTLDLRGHGESISEEVPDYKLLETDKERETLWAFATRDVEEAARWLRSDKRVHTSNLSVVGIGAGCALAVRQASRDVNVRTITLMNPKRELLGFDLMDDMYEVEGLPTFFLTSKESREDVEVLVEAIHGELGCEKPFIQVSNLKAKMDADTLKDKKLGKTITKCIGGETFPKRGSRGGR